MQQITAPVTAPGRTDRPRGRWIWPLTGTATVLLLGAAISVAAIKAGTDNFGNQSALPTRTVTVNGPVTSLNVSSYGAPIRVTRGPVSQVTVVETISFDGPDHPSAVRASDHDGAVTLAAPSCEYGHCSVGFAVTVPSGFPDVTVTATSENGAVSVSGAGTTDIDSGGGPVTASAIRGALTVTSEDGSITVSGAGSASLDSGGGPVTVNGVTGPLNVSSEDGSIDAHGTGSATLDSGGGPVTASAIHGALTVIADSGSVNVSGAQGADLNSGGGPVTARSIDGPLSATTDSGSLEVDGLTGPLTADTSGGPVNASGIASATARVNTDSGPASISFARAPQSVSVTTGGGSATLVLPGGPYAVNAQSFGGPVGVSVPVSPTAADTISVNTAGGELQVKPPGAS